MLTSTPQLSNRQSAKGVPPMSDTSKTGSSEQPKSGTSRRDFIRASSAIVAGAAATTGTISVARGANAFGSDTIKIG
ncbi:MAG: twin-arginine translocation signal domain-containing protein, partial [Planctomycetales bacterium]|nr:twin-arginine translocation signal domain-containing protein [Planctomycetales bacterium]